MERIAALSIRDGINRPPEPAPSLATTTIDSPTKLEHLLTEFYAPNTNNERKKEINSMLLDFNNIPEAWKVCYVFFQQTTSEYTKMYCLNVIDSFVDQRWLLEDPGLRDSFRSSLWKYLLDHHVYWSNLIKNKVCKIIVMIARFDWPERYPNFMADVLELLVPEKVASSGGQEQSSSLLLLGLNLLYTSIDEFSNNTQNHIILRRRKELEWWVHNSVVSILRSLSVLLELIISKHINFISATPPPSPTGSPTSNESFLNANIQPKETLINLFQNGIKKGLLNSIPDMDAESIKVTSKIFACFAQIVSIMPVSNYQDIDSTFLSGLYVFATFGSVNPSYHSASLGIDAMSCVNELISKTAVFNSEANEFIYNVFQNIFIILQRVMNGSPRTSPANLNGCEDGPVSTNFKDVDEVYLTKFITFLKLFVAGHLARFEKLIDFSTKELLAAMLELTTKMQQHSIECYFQLLEIWTIYFEYLQNSLQVKHKENNTISPEKLQSIKETIFELLIYLLRSIQFSINADFLAQLDDRTPDDDGRTELEHFMYRTIEVIANIGEVYPHETVHYIDANCFHDKLRNLQYGLEFYAGHNGEQWPVRYKNGHASKLMPMEILRHHPLGQLQVNLLDFITTLQVCSRFSNFFVQESFDSYFVLTKAIFDKLFAILQFVNIQHLCDIASSHTSKGGRGTRSQHPLLREFVLLKAQIIATFKAYIVWFQQFCFIRNTDANANETSTTSKSYANQEQFNPEAEHYLTVIFDTCCSIVSDATILERNINDDEDVCEAISTLYHSASLTLSTFSLNVRPAFVFALPSVQRLIEVDSLDRLLQLGKDSGKVLVPLSDQILLSQSITNLLVLPWFMVSNEAQDWDKRSERLSALIGYYLQLFNRLNLESSVGSTKVSKLPPNDYCRSLYILRKMIKSHADSPAKSKQMLLLPLSTSLEAFTQLLQTNSLLHTTVAGCQITEHILALFNVVFDVLLGQISIDLVRRTMQALLQIIAWHDILNGKGRQANFKAIDIQSALKVIIKFMKLLTLIVKQTSVNNSLRSLLPEIINFTAANIQTNLICMKTSSIGAALVNDRSSNYDVYAKLLKVYYQFYYELLLNNNRYFFPKSSLAPLKQLTTTSNATTSTPGEEQKRQYFERIMEIFGQSFEMVCNIQLYQQNVESLESLNKTVRLYTREAFKGAFLQRFLYMFVKALLDGTVPLLEESILEIVFHLAEVDFVHFYDIFLPEFVSNIPILSVERRVSLVERAACGLRDPNTGVRLASTDLPTFSSHLNQLLSDLRLYIKFAAIPHHLF